MDELEHTYDGKFEGNVLVVGRTACQKEHLCRMWANTIGDIFEVYWVSKIALSEEREDAIRVFLIKKCILTTQETWKILII